MVVKKIIGFVVGALLSGAIWIATTIAIGLRPNAYSLLAIAFFGGSLGASLTIKFTDYLKSAENPIPKKWWGANVHLRFSIVLSALWVCGANIFIDTYDRNFTNTYAPAIFILFSYAAFSLLVSPPEKASIEPVPGLSPSPSPQEQPPHNTDLRPPAPRATLYQTPAGEWQHLSASPSEQAESKNAEKTSAGQISHLEHGKSLVNGCVVSQTSENRWKIRPPTGGTMYASSNQQLEKILSQYADHNKSQNSESNRNP